MSQGEFSRKCRKFKSSPIIGGFRYLVATTYCRYYLLWVSIAAIIDGAIKETFLYLSAERTSTSPSQSSSFVRKIYLNIASGALKILMYPQLHFNRVYIIVFIERSPASRSSRTVNCVDYIFSPEYYITIKVLVFG